MGSRHFTCVFVRAGSLVMEVCVGVYGRDACSVSVLHFILLVKSFYSAYL
jgi:hypothetical protein